MVNIRTVEAADAEKFLSMLRKLDKETNFMMYEPDERTTTIAEMSERINESLKNSSLMIVAEVNS